MEPAKVLVRDEIPEAREKLLTRERRLVPHHVVARQAGTVCHQIVGVMRSLATGSWSVKSGR